MDRITDYLSMGGYAEFVWPAFAVTIAVMAALVFFSRRALLADRATLASLESGRKSRDGGESEQKSRRGGAREARDGGTDDGGTDNEA